MPPTSSENVDALRAEIDRLQNLLEAGPPRPVSRFEETARAFAAAMLSNGAGAGNGIESVNDLAIEAAKDFTTKIEKEE
ncbi:hypothetical protein [Pseudophaeobacter sp.]|uniref:hypothetical protein n=1 Tax=Pseudophaeobacter sp. TaxID=1971739 RepID=UPI0032986DCB